MKAPHTVCRKCSNKTGENKLLLHCLPNVFTLFSANSTYFTQKDYSRGWTNKNLPAIEACWGLVTYV